MKIDVKFSQNSTAIQADMSTQPKNIQTSMGVTTVLHDGQNGATFFPAVSEDGVLSWTNDRELDNPQPVNIKGKDGRDGVDGYTPVKGKDYFDGKDGKDGEAGADGRTPEKGVDYFTDADKAEMVAAVIAALPVEQWTFVLEDGSEVIKAVYAG